MNPALRTTLTIGVLLAGLLLAASWGWSKVTAPLPGIAPDDTTALCTETPVRAGDQVTPAQVTISVLNAGKRQGLAGRTMEEFTSQGFNAGESANAPSTNRVTTVEIWTDDPDSPAVALVASRLGAVRVVQTAIEQVGVVVVVGDKFTKVGPGAASVTASTDTTICSPSASTT